MADPVSEDTGLDLDGNEATKRLWANLIRDKEAAQSEARALREQVATLTAALTEAVDLATCLMGYPALDYFIEKHGYDDELAELSALLASHGEG